ncbi:MAG: hypothetical protein SGARI_002090 [Bacillariaceae sp.]
MKFSVADLIGILFANIFVLQSSQSQTEAANDAALNASEAKKQGDLLTALDCHAKAAKLYKEGAMATRDRNGM